VTAAPTPSVCPDDHCRTLPSLEAARLVRGLPGDCRGLASVRQRPNGMRVNQLGDSRGRLILRARVKLVRKLTFEIVLHDGAESLEHEGLLDPCVRHAVQEGRSAFGEDATGDEHHARRLF